MVTMSIENGMYYGMNAVASRIWELIPEPKSISEVCDTLLDEYQVDPEQCEKEVLALVSQLNDEGLIVVQ